MTHLHLPSSVRLALGFGGLALLSKLAAAADPFPAQLDLDALPSDEGVLINERPGTWRFGYAVEMVSDVNGDGIDDLLIGAPYTPVGDSPRAGVAYVIFGNTELGADGPVQIPGLAVGEGLSILGRRPESQTGAFVSGAGDVDGDGLDDILIGAPNFVVLYGDPKAGETYLIFGSEALSERNELDLNAPGTDDVVVLAQPAPTDAYRFGRQVGAIGDVNGDGLDDFVVSGEYSQNEGVAFVVYGDPSLRDRPVFPLAELDGSNGFVVRTPRLLDSVAGGGDLNGDGFADLVLGSPSENLSDSDGATYVLFGGDDVGRDGIVDTTALSEVLSLTVRAANGTGSRPGYGARVVGDINGDGFDDLALGDPFQLPEESYLIFGAQDLAQPGATLFVSDLDGTQGITLRGEPQLSSFGGDVTGAGDLNADGVDDLLIGDSAQASGLILFGSPLLGEQSVVFVEQFDGLKGFRALSNPGDQTGQAVSGGKDLNADGVADIILGAPDPFSQAVYVVFGRVLPADLDRDGIADVEDNCQLAVNGDQRDSNGDGYGNLCDADLDDSCVVAPADWLLMRDVLGTADADADLDGNGRVDLQDARRLFDHRGLAPGPSGVTDACD
ncbi:MAG: integrin alpha [Pseudomonadota bacterium]